MFKIGMWTYDFDKMEQFNSCLEICKIKIIDNMFYFNNINSNWILDYNQEEISKAYKKWNIDKKMKEILTEEN